MSNWKESLEDFKEDYAAFLKRKYNNFDKNELEEALEHWENIVELAEMVREDLSARVDELEGVEE